jgi:hypothetical protein
MRKEIHLPTQRAVRREGERFIGYGLPFFVTFVEALADFENGDPRIKSSGFDVDLDVLRQCSG